MRERETEGKFWRQTEKQSILFYQNLFPFLYMQPDPGGNPSCYFRTCVNCSTSSVDSFNFVVSRAHSDATHSLVLSAPAPKKSRRGPLPPLRGERVPTGGEDESHR